MDDAIITTRVDKLTKEAAAKLAKRRGWTVSSLMRALLTRELKRAGLLPEETVAS